MKDGFVPSDESLLLWPMRSEPWRSWLKITPQQDVVASNDQDLRQPGCFACRSDSRWSRHLAGLIKGWYLHNSELVRVKDTQRRMCSVLQSSTGMYGQRSMFAKHYIGATWPSDPQRPVGDGFWTNSPWLRLAFSSFLLRTRCIRNGGIMDTVAAGVLVVAMVADLMLVSASAPGIGVRISRIRPVGRPNRWASGGSAVWNGCCCVSADWLGSMLEDGFESPDCRWLRLGLLWLLRRWPQQSAALQITGDSGFMVKYSSVLDMGRSTIHVSNCRMSGATDQRKW